jgi:SWI/SNF-related matrix-associated actin-dependent regulator 1 of chromatin subfamily A
MKGSHYLINAVFARAKNMPTSFIGIVVRQSKKAIWVYGHGAMDPEGHCACCGRRLTHPGSILIGIGPECLGNWGARDVRLENITPEEKKRLQSYITDKKVDGWIPRTCIKKNTPVEEEIHLPKDHASLPNVSESPTGRINVNTDPPQQHINPILQTIEKKEEVIKQAVLWKGVIAIRFPYAYETVQKVKGLDGRKYIPEGKYWTCPLKAHSIRELKGWGFLLDEKLEEHLKGFQGHLELTGEKKIVKSVEIPGLKRQLFPFQKEGVAFIDSRNGRALVGDEMGLGKTIQALAYLQLHPEHRPAIIICPASLKLNWAKEIQSTMTQRTRVQILEGKRPRRLHGEILIINYDILSFWLKELLAFKPAIIIADECHYFKSNATKRTKAVKLLAKPVPHFIALSGTPIVNRPIEIYNALAIINSSVIPSFMEYAKKFCGAHHNGFGWDFNGASNTEELHKILTETIMIRRKKADVLKDLPDKIHSFVPMTLSNQQEYDSIESDVIGFLRNTKGDQAADTASNAEVVVQIEMLKQAAVRGKLNAVVSWVEDFLESDEKLVLFATHKFVIDKLMERFAGLAVKIAGGTSMEDRNKAVEHFQTNPKVKLFIGNIKAAGVGLTLTAASNVGMIEYPWTPGDLKQAEDRCHRIGQKNTVNVYHLVVPGTIEEEIAELLDKKTKVLNAVLDGVETHQESLLSSLINSITKKQRK